MQDFDAFRGKRTNGPSNSQGRNNVNGYSLLNRKDNGQTSSSTFTNARSLIFAPISIYMRVGLSVGQSIGQSVSQSVGRSVGQSVGRLVGWSVGWSVSNAFVKISEKWIFTDSKRFRHYLVL